LRINADGRAEFGIPSDGDVKYINQHPWKLSRRDCLVKKLQKLKLQNFVDIGVDDMFYTKQLRSFATGKVYAVDIFFDENETIIDGIICVNSIQKIPDNEIDCLVMMDVLEHIEDDAAFLRNAVAKIKENGTILITVPAWQFLFSKHDEKSHHFRRYNRKQLLSLLKTANIKVKRCHYFFTSLFLVRLVSMAKKDFAGNESAWAYTEKHIKTKIMKIILDIDFTVNKLLDKIGIHLPGLSLTALCKKEA
jgi:SAM-dependent methyltransferase